MGIFSWVGDTFHKLTGTPTSHEQRQMKRQMQAQVKAYKEQTRLAQEEINRAKDQETAEKRRIDEKQIRALRRSHGAQGFLGTSPETELGQTSKLGG